MNLHYLQAHCIIIDPKKEDGQMGEIITLLIISSIIGALIMGCLQQIMRILKLRRKD